MIILMGGGPFYSIEEARNKNLLKRGDIIQIKRSPIYSHTIIFESYDKCYHVSSDRNNYDSFKTALTLGSAGVRVYVRRHALEDILYSGPRDQNGVAIIKIDDEGKEIPLTLDLLRVNNQEEEARRSRIDVNLCNKGVYLYKMFEKLAHLVSNDESVDYNLLTNNCDCFAYGMKYKQKWSPQIQAVTSPVVYCLGKRLS